jgi:hypothetical protein
MGFFKRFIQEPELCPNCRKPLAEGIVFCDSCGMRVSPPPTCGKCNTPLAPETNFCESCGTPVGTRPAESSGLSAPDERHPATHKKKERATKGRKAIKKAPKKDEFVLPSMLLPEPAAAEKTFVDPVPEPGEDRTAGPIPASVKPEVPEEIPSKSQKRPEISKKALGVAGLVILGIILALAVVTGHVHLSAPSFMQGPTAPASQAASPATSGPSDLTTSYSMPTIVGQSFVPGPTWVPPESLQIWLQDERDPITHIVTVIFNGGKGQRGVREIQVRLTRSDGEVLTRTFKPVMTGEGVSLQGTKYTDHLEVVVSYNNGENYTIIDRVFEYKIRN